MGIGRREFLSMMGIAIGHRLISGPSTRIIADDRFVRTDLGISFEKPGDWIFITPEEVRAVADKIGEKAGIAEMTPSVINISKEAWRIPPRFTPGINVWTYAKEDHESLASFMESSLAGSGFYQDFRVTSAAKEIAVSSCPAMVATATLLFDHSGMPAPVPVRNRFLCIEQEARHYLITMCDAPAMGMHEVESFDRVQESIILA